MTIGMWWADTLESFAEAMGLQCEVVQDKRPTVRRSGEWWVQDNVWNVQLDTWSHARVDAVAESEAIRRALTVALGNASAAADRQLSWPQVLTGHFSELVHLALTDEWAGVHPPSHVVQRLTVRDLDMPVRFAWLEFAVGKTDAAELRANVREVVSELEGVTFLGWTSHPQGLQGALIALSGSAAVYGGSDGERHSGSDAGGLQQELDMLAGALESEVMVRASLTVGARFDRPSDCAHGLYTLAHAWREHVWFVPGQAAYVWGRHPLTYLLATLEDAMVDPFLAMVATTRPAEGTLLLPPDLAETLQGVLAANLNVSEASRILYLHRNTLMNRIERIRLQTGFDIRQFDDALLLWIAQSLLRRRREAPIGVTDAGKG